MDEDFRKAALDYHRLPVPGKLAIEATKRMATQRDLALAYSPGVAAACLEIKRDPTTALDYTAPALPADKPRYLMGVGTPDDLLGAVARGVDMFDCVMPTRAGRTARAFTRRGIFNVRNSRFSSDDGALDPECGCPLCTKHSRAYLHHLFRCEEMLGPMLLTWHNIQYYQDLMRGLRDAIGQGRLDAFASTFAEAESRGDIDLL